MSLAHNVWGMGKKGREQARPFVFARLGAEEDLDADVVRGMQGALDKLLRQLVARDGGAAVSQSKPTQEAPDVVTALAARVRTHENGLRMLTSVSAVGIRHVVETVWTRLRLDRVAKECAAENRIAFDFERILFAMVLNRLVDPSSKRACNECVQDVVWFPEADGWDVRMFYPTRSGPDGHQSDHLICGGRSAVQGVHHSPEWLLQQLPSALVRIGSYRARRTDPTSFPPSVGR